MASKLSGPKLSGIEQFCFQKLVIFTHLANSCHLLIINSCLSMSHLRMDSHVRSGPRSSKMWLGPPPSEVAPAKLLRDIFLAQVITPLTPATMSRMSASSMRGMLPRSSRIIMPSATLRSQSKALSMKTEKLQSMRAASNPVTLAFGLFSTRTGTVQSTSTKRSPWWKLSGSTGIGWQRKGTPSLTK
jgi:hypothetical protein